jgi:hypothetical protein
VATAAGLMQTYFQHKGEPLLDEFNEVLELVGYLEVENAGGSAEVDPTAVLISPTGNGVKGALKKAVKLFYKVKGAQKYYPQRSYVSKAITTLSLTTFAIGVYVGLSGDTSKGVLLALDSVKLSSELLGAVDTVYSFYKVGKGFADRVTALATVASLERSTKLAAAIGLVFDVAMPPPFLPYPSRMWSQGRLPLTRCWQATLRGSFSRSFPLSSLRR